MQNNVIAIPTHKAEVRNLMAQGSGDQHKVLITTQVMNPSEKYIVAVCTFIYF